MLQEMREIFQKMLEEKGERLVLDQYVPKPGTYRLVILEEEGIRVKKTLEIGYDNKAKTIQGESDSDYGLFRELDYWSKLLEMNKPVDSKKIIHSNQYLCIWIKKESLKEGKLTKEILDGYFGTLRALRDKYQKPKTRALYEQTVEMLGEVDGALLSRIRQEIARTEIWEDIDLDKKNYLKIYFAFPDEEKTKNLYRQEGLRYLLPNIYNNNDYNLVTGAGVLGVPNQNTNLNSKKPYLLHHGRKAGAPYLLGRQEVLLEAKLFDYLAGLAAKDKVNVYFRPEKGTIEAFHDMDKAEVEHSSNAYYVRLGRGKEVEILQFDTVNAWRTNPKPFILQNHMGVQIDEEKGKGGDYGKSITQMWEMKYLLDGSFFEGKMFRSFFLEAKEVPISDPKVRHIFVENREWLHAWFYKGRLDRVAKLFDRMSLQLIVNSIQNNEWGRAKRQFNIRWSLLDYFHEDRRYEERMENVREQLRKHLDEKEDWEFSSHREFCYALGQAASYLISKSKARRIPEAWINPFLDAKNVKIAQQRLKVVYQKYNHDCDLYPGGRADQLLAGVMKYQSQEKVDQEMIMAGFLDRRLVYEKREEGGKQE